MLLGVGGGKTFNTFFVCNMIFKKFLLLFFLFISYSITVHPISPPLPFSAQPSPCSQSHRQRDELKNTYECPMGIADDAGIDCGAFNNFFKRRGDVQQCAG